MKLLKYLFFILLIGIIGFTIYVATLDGDFHVEESLTVEAPPEMLFDEVNNYETWSDWAPWAEKFPNMIVDYPGKTAGEGAQYSWKTENMQGNMTTTKVVPGKTIEQKAVYNTPVGESTHQVYWNFEETENGTKITWGIKGDQGFMEKAYGLTQDSTMTEKLRPMMKAGLENLSTNVKKAMEEYSINVDGLTQHSGGFYMYMTTASRNAPKALSAKIGRILPQVHLYMEENQIAMTGSPMTVYNQIDEQNGTVIISCGIPTSNRIITTPESEVLCGFLPSQNAIKTTLRGNYKHLPEAWEAAKSYIAENGYAMPGNAQPFEVYVTDPGETQNPAEWVTEVYIPVGVSQSNVQ
jgi:effector-binding domain-containing protein